LLGLVLSVLRITHWQVDSGRQCVESGGALSETVATVSLRTEKMLSMPDRTDVVPGRNSTRNCSGSISSSHYIQLEWAESNMSPFDRKFNDHTNTKPTITYRDCGKSFDACKFTRSSAVDCCCCSGRMYSIPAHNVIKIIHKPKLNARDDVWLLHTLTTHA